MSIWKIITRSLIYYRRTHIGMVFGTALGTAILVGALMVGDSVRFSLQRMVNDRLGHSVYTLEMGDRYFRAELAGRLSKNIDTPVVPLLQTQGIVIAAGGQRRANRVQVVGINSRFGKLADLPDSFFDLKHGEVIINKQLAGQLGLNHGDDILLRFLRLQYLPKDAPLAKDSDLSVARKYQIKQIVGIDELGNFNLRTNQVAPATVFISLAEINEAMDLKNRANTLLITERRGKPLTADELQEALSNEWSIEDVGLHLEEISDPGVVELRSERLFLEPVITNAVKSIGEEFTPIFTYFVNELKAKQHTTPYSFVSAAGLPLVPAELNDQEIIINQWLASDLMITAGDSLSLFYYVVGPMRQLVEKKSSFKVSSVVPLAGIYADKKLMPDYPGLADASNCRDWDPGIPLDLDKIRRKDEKYWDSYKGIPKGFVSLNAAQSMWRNRFGNLTAIRFAHTEIPLIDEKIKNVLRPSEMGMHFRAVREEGIKASTKSVSFSELFLGLSFFVVVAALLLTALFSLLTVEQRAHETGLYLALGFPKNMIGRLIYYENGLLIIVGSLLGSILGVLYNQMILIALKTIWLDAVGTSALEMKIEIGSVLIGMTTGMMLALLTTGLVLRNQTRRTVAGLLSETDASEPASLERKTRASQLIAWTSLSVAGGFILYSSLIKNSPGSFFAAGALLLISSLAFIYSFFSGISQKTSAKHLNLKKIALRNSARHQIRSLMLVGLLASGLFIVFTVGANRHGELQDVHLRSSGTGGFTLFAESVVPVLYELKSAEGRKVYNLEDSLFNRVDYVPFRFREGDDASCLNLNRVANPNLLGVNPSLLNNRKAFTFSSFVTGAESANSWMALNKWTDETVIPGIADETVIVWGLGKSVGDTLLYTDEYGQIFKIRLIAGLANSVFQGNIIISEEAFLKKYPSVNGHRVFLIDTASDETDPIAERLSWAMQDLGFSLTSTSARLMAFNAVENTYLSIFLILGGFGLILGTIGIGIVVIRNTLERRSELALLRAFGFTRRSVGIFLLTEHLFLLMLGAVCGAGASLIAVLPVWITAGATVPYLTIIIIFVLVAGSGTVWTLLAAKMALSQNLISSLQAE